MKLFELFDTEYKNRYIKKKFDKEKAEDNRISADWGESGTGYSSTVKHKKNDPFLVKKTSSVPRENLEETDGYYAYIKAIADDKLASSNPYFPRVYNVKTYTDPNGLQQFKSDMETLIEPTDITEKELMHVGKMMYNDFDEHFQRYNNNSNNSRDTKQKIIFTLVSLFEDSLYSRSYIKDPNLREVVDLVSALLKKYKKLEIDMNMGNIMFRRGQSGVQVVITDPLTQVN